MNSFSTSDLAKRFCWDLMDRNERKYYLYFLISQIPGAFGDMLRGRYLSSRVRHAGKNFRVQSGTRFRSMENLVVGDNVIIGYDNFIQALGGVTIGDNVLTAPGVKIWSINHNFRDRDSLIIHQGQTAGAVTIGNDVWIAANAFISPGVSLPDGSVVSSGAVVGVKEYKPYSILAGNPARVIGFREKAEESCGPGEKE